MSAPRCCFCGITEAWVAQVRALGSSRRDPQWQDVAGRPVCDADCAEKERARQDAVAFELVHMHSEVDGLWGLSLDQQHVGPCANLDELLDKIAMEDMS